MKQRKNADLLSRGRVGLRDERANKLHACDRLGKNLT